MTLVHHYSTPTTPAGIGSDTIISTSVQLVDEKGFSARATLGEADIVKVIVDDPLGVYDFKGLKRWYMVETDCAAVDQLVWNGYVGHQRISRGAGSSTLFPFGRRWSLDLVQENTILGFRIVTGTDGNRPAETVSARLTWLLASPYLSTVVDHGLIVPSTLPMDAVDYRHQYAKDVLADLAVATGFNYYARYHEASGDIQLAFYDPNTNLLDPSTLRISNVSGDVDYALTWPPFEDAELDRSPDSTAAGIDLPYATGSVYDYRLATSYEFGFRDMAAPSANVKTAAKANALLARLLTQHSTQDEQITGVRLRLPSANVNDVKHGQLINAKFSHLPGSEAFRPMRVVSKVFSRPDNLTQTHYDVDLDLSPVPSASFLVAFTANATDPKPTDDSTNPWTLAWWSGDFCLTSVIACGAGPPFNQGMGMFYRKIVPGESATVLTFKNASISAGGTWVYQVGGIDLATILSTISVVNANQFLANAGTVTVTATASAQSTLLGGVAFGKVNYDDGWLADSSSNWGGVNLVTRVTGTQLVNASSFNNTGARGAAPWAWIAHAEGSGALSLSAVADSHGGGSGAYNCGYNVGKGGLLIPTPGGFSIVQSAYGGNQSPGGTYSVVLPAPPRP